MIIDTGGYLGNFPYRKLQRTNPFELNFYVSKLGITHMIVSSINAVFYKDASEGNNDLFENMKTYNGQTEFIPFAVCNPTYPEWKKDLVYAVCNQGFKGIDLFPQYHNYSLSETITSSVLELAEKYRLPIRIANGFENIRQRSHMDTLNELENCNLISFAKKNKEVTFIFNGFYSLGLAKEVKEKNISNVYYDFARSDVFPNVNDDMLVIIKKYGADNLCFSSFSPLQYIEPQLLKLSIENISVENKEKIAYKNLFKLLNVKE